MISTFYIDDVRYFILTGMRSRPATAPGVGTFGLGEPLGELCDVSTPPPPPYPQEARANGESIIIFIHIIQ